MLGIVKNNKIIPLTTDTGTGASVGTLIQQYKKVPMSGYLYCDGSTFDENVYPALYMYLGTNVLPDYRECVMVGAEQNTTDTIATHDVYTEGEFKDDQLQDHYHNLSRTDEGLSNLLFYQNNGEGENWHGALTTTLTGKTATIITTSKDHTGRGGDTTHGKQKAVYVYIKATSGLAENQQDNVLNDVKDYALAKSKIRTGIVSGGSANSDDWVATFDTPFEDNNYYVIVTPKSLGGGSNCPSGWYIVLQTATGFAIYCNGNAPKNGFYYIAIHN